MYVYAFSWFISMDFFSLTAGSYGSSPDRMTGTLFPDTRYYRVS